jgi:hypothetical protein
MLLALVSETGSKRRQSKPSRCVRHNQGFQQFNLLILIASLSSASSQNDARKIPGSELWEQHVSEIETTQKTMREACWGEIRRWLFGNFATCMQLWKKICKF